MASQLENVRCYIKHCRGVYEQNNIMKSVRVVDWTAERAITGSNDVENIHITQISSRIVIFMSVRIKFMEKKVKYYLRSLFVPLPCINAVNPSLIILTAHSFITLQLA